MRGSTLSHQGRPTRVTIIRDITERKRVEAEQRALAERVQQAQKLESLGVLAGGVAHDFNNLLTVISNGVTLAKREAGLGVASAAHLDAIALAAERAADLCRQMLAYAGKARLSREPVELSALVERDVEHAGGLHLVEGPARAGARAAGFRTLLGDATQIRQIVMNLVLNASEALRGGRGSIRVSTGTGHLRGGGVRALRGRGRAEGRACTSGSRSRTTASAWNASTVAQMFDPFFTTKFVGRGLGMAAVLGIVRGHGGAIDVESSPGRGTRVRVFFPACTLEPGRARRPTPAAEPWGQGLVLVVDDDKNVLLSPPPCSCAGSASGAASRATAPRPSRSSGSASARIDVVLLDLTMPRMNSLETLKELRRIAPAIPVILTSGYGQDALRRRPEARRGARRRSSRNRTPRKTCSRRFTR